MAAPTPVADVATLGDVKSWDWAIGSTNPLSLSAWKHAETAHRRIHVLEEMVEQMIKEGCGQRELAVSLEGA